MTLLRDFFDCLGKALEVVASLRREGIDNDSRKKNRQGRKGLVQCLLYKECESMAKSIWNPAVRQAAADRMCS